MYRLLDAERTERYEGTNINLISVEKIITLVFIF